MEQVKAGEITADRSTPEQPEDAESATGPKARGLTISVEALAWTAMVGAGAALRLVSLDRLPLTVSEASRALDAARVAGGDVPETWRGDLAAAVTSYLFRILGESELVARLLPAMAAAALLVLLWFVRPYVGRLGALVAGALVAFSPLFVVFSRSALPFSAGTVLALAMVLSLFGYLREPRSWLVFPLVVSLALAPLTDAVAVSAAIAILAFIAIEVSFLGSNEMTRAWETFRRSPLQWVSALLVLGAALELGLTHFGTSLHRTGLPGLRQWTDMFATPRDSRAPEYHFALLLAYDWPLLLLGSAGFLTLAWRLRRPSRATPLRLRSGQALRLRSGQAFQRFLLVGTSLSALTLALTTQREAGQLLLVLLPLALLAGYAVEEAVTAIDWSVLRRWWPALAGSLLLLAYSALLMTECSSPEGVPPLDRFLLVLAFGSALFLIAIPYPTLYRHGSAVALPVVAVLAAAFVAHSSLAVTFDDGAEFAVDARLTGRAEQFQQTLDGLAAERGGTIVVDEGLLPALGWTLRDSPVVFGGPVAGAAAVVAPPNAGPDGFVGLGEVWRLAEGWYPEQLLRPRGMWRWLVYREPYGELKTVEVRIYVPTV